MKMKNRKSKKKLKKNKILSQKYRPYMFSVLEVYFYMLIISL